MSNARLVKPKTVKSPVGDMPLTPDGIPNLDAWEREDADLPPFRLHIGGKDRTFIHPKDLPSSSVKHLFSQDVELILATILCEGDRYEILELDLSFGKLDALARLYMDYHGLDEQAVGNGSASPS